MSEYVNKYMNTPIEIHTTPVIEAVLIRLHGYEEGVLARDLRKHFCSKEYMVDYWWVTHEFDRILRRMREELKLIEPVMTSPGKEWGAVTLVGYKLTVDGWIIVQQLIAGR